MKKIFKSTKLQRALNILFILNHQLIAFNRNVSANTKVDNLTRTIIETINHFAPEKPHTENAIQTFTTNIDV